MFIYNVDGNTVVAILKDTECDAISVINKHAKNIGGYVFDDYLMKNEYVGIAKCHELDNFDLEFGKELAKRRALNAHHQDLKEKVRKYFNALDDAKSSLEISLKKFDYNGQNLKKLLDNKR